jgi:lipoic acid synthetase
MILGNKCTRNCRFCNVEAAVEKNLGVDSGEPLRVAEAIKFLKLKYAVVTSVTRDDLTDGGAGHFAKTIQAVREINPGAEIEVLIPDFQGSFPALEVVVNEKPEVISHNLETVERIFPLVRRQADYKRSLNLLKNIKLINPGQTTKSSLILGLGETDSDLKQALCDLRSVNCDMLVLGQYLSPSENHYPVEKFYSPQEFESWKDFAYELGFRNVCSFPLARTSYPNKKEELCTTS